MLLSRKLCFLARRNRVSNPRCVPKLEFGNEEREQPRRQTTHSLRRRRLELWPRYFGFAGERDGFAGESAGCGLPAGGFIAGEDLGAAGIATAGVGDGESFFS